MDGFEVGGLDDDAGFLFDHYSRLDQGFARRGVFDVFGGATAEDLVRQRRDYIAAIDHGADGNTGLGFAVFGDDDAVLGDVDQAPGQIPRIGGLERRIGQALAGAVGGIEILQNRQPFLEVRNDRGFDDFPGRLGHQAAHASQLFHLCRRTAGPRMGHHVNRIHGFPGLLGRNDLHHLVGDAVRAMGPCIDNLVVFFTLGNQAVQVLLLIFLDHVLGLGDKPFLGVGNHKVVLAERNAGHAGIM